ncbi:hypothetical protein [Actinomycetospora sp.]|uniref:hypothetical protein n=1 Tax=Actinomycetospora sp. TaxID=1872135 RepID=UPI002F4145B8
MNPSDNADGGATGDRVDLIADAPPPRSETSDARPPALADQVRSSDLIAEVTLAQGVTYTPAGLGVLRTSYVFQVDRVVRGREGDAHVTVNDTGGAYADGSTVSTENSFRLSPGHRYLIFADRVDGELWLRHVLQVREGGAVVADASGRALTGFHEGVATVEPEATYEAARYIRQVTTSPAPMERGPDEASVPQAEVRPPAAAESGRVAALSLDAVIESVREAQGATTSSGNPGPTRAAPSESPPATPPAPNIEGRSQETPGAGTAEGILSGNYVTAFQSHFHYMPDNDNWAWTSHCRSSWNALVGNNLGLFAYKVRTSDNQPIRDRLPVANNGQNNVGVLTSAQMTTAGFDTWETLGANGVCYTWTGGNRITETDILINPAIAGNEAQFRKSLTHELGHALTLQHEQRRMALLYPGTYQQPPNYGSLWYSRQDDHNAVRSMLAWVNANVAAGTWAVTQFTDMATWSQAHSNPGTTGNLVMTRIASETIQRGSSVAIQFVHVENRGNVPAQNVRLSFYLSTNDVISATDREIGTFTWTTFSTWWSGSLTLAVPSSVPPGQYFLGWIVSTDSPELSSSNNTALLLRDYTTGFARVQVSVV